MRLASARGENYSLNHRHARQVPYVFEGRFVFFYRKP
jgi:hypothetical protein